MQYFMSSVGHTQLALELGIGDLFFLVVVFLFVCFLVSNVLEGFPSPLWSCTVAVL